MIYALVGVVIGMLLASSVLGLVAFMQFRSGAPVREVERMVERLKKEAGGKAVILNGKTPMALAREKIIKEYEARGEEAPIEEL